MDASSGSKFAHTSRRSRSPGRRLAMATIALVVGLSLSLSAAGLASAAVYVAAPSPTPNAPAVPNPPPMGVMLLVDTSSSARALQPAATRTLDRVTSPASFEPDQAYSWGDRRAAETPTKGMRAPVVASGRFDWLLAAPSTGPPGNYATDVETAAKPGLASSTRSLVLRGVSPSMHIGKRDQDVLHGHGDYYGVDATNQRADHRIAAGRGDRFATSSAAPITPVASAARNGGGMAFGNYRLAAAAILAIGALLAGLVAYGGATGRWMRGRTASDPQTPRKPLRDSEPYRWLTKSHGLIAWAGPRTDELAIGGWA